MFKGIDDLYAQAGSKYLKKSSQELKIRKAKMLLKIVLSISPKLNLKVLRASRVHERGVDILALNDKGETIGVELKAYNKFEKIKKKNIEQLKRMLMKEGIKNGLLITSTSIVQKNLQIPQNINLLLYDKLRELCDKEHLNKLKFIRTFSIHREIYENETKKKKIIDYTKEKFKIGQDISYIGILKDLNLHVYTYFESIYDIYEEAGVPIPLKKIGFKRAKNENLKTKKAKEEFINKILDFIKEEVKKGHYPSGYDIGEKFGRKHIWNHINASDLYRMLKLPIYLERRKLGLQSAR